jgi:hypothetical protein
MQNLKDLEVYTYQEGRVLDRDEKPVPDVVSDGAAALMHRTTTTPLAEFNTQCENARARRRMKPISELSVY